MFLFKSKKPIEPKKEAEQVNVDLELVTKMNQDFALSLDLNDTLMNALRVIIARLNAEAANNFLINEQKKKFECIASLHHDEVMQYIQTFSFARLLKNCLQLLHSVLQLLLSMHSLGCRLNQEIKQSLDSFL